MKRPELVPTWLTPEIQEAFEGYKAMRKLIKKPMTERAQIRMLGKLERFAACGFNVVEILERSEDKCYTDVYAPEVSQGVMARLLDKSWAN